MNAITDDYMREMLTHTRPFSVVLIRRTALYDPVQSPPIVWEHGRRNFELRAAGKLLIVCPVTDDSGWAGVGIFKGDVPEITALMATDPGVVAGIFSFAVHPVRSFPGDALTA